MDKEPWVPTLLKFEEKNGALWKFGPVDLKNGSELYSTFGSIASTRIFAPEQDGDDCSRRSSGACGEGGGTPGKLERLQLPKRCGVYSPDSDENTPTGRGRSHSHVSSNCSETPLWDAEGEISSAYNSSCNVSRNCSIVGMTMTAPDQNGNYSIIPGR